MVKFYSYFNENRAKNSIFVIRIPPTGEKCHYSFGAYSPWAIKITSQEHQ